MERSYGPAARKLSMFLIACETISGEKRGTELSSRQSLRSFHLTIRVDGSLVWDRAEVNCLGKAVAIYRLRMRVLEEKLMGSSGGVSVRFPLRNLIMLHRCEGLHLCEQDSWFGLIFVIWRF